jgi:Lamin Tail Domain
MRTAVLRCPALAGTVLASMVLASTAAAGMLTLSGPAAAAPAAAARRAPSPVVISEIFYNSPGSDHGSNASLNAEWVKLRNRTGHRVSLDGWTLRDTAHHVYRFVGHSLRAHGTVRIHTGSGRDTQRNLFQDRGWYVWNNDGDTAILRGPAGNTRDRCSYSDSSENFDAVDC